MNPDDRARRIRTLTDLAIRLANESKWTEALAANQELIQITNQNSNILNRLGKAYSELGRISEAKQAYSDSLHCEPDNAIAKRNLERLALLKDEGELDSVGGDKINPQLFIEEIGKTGRTNLITLASAETVARLAAGEQVNIEVDGHSLLIKNGRNELIGQVEPILANRLINFITGGNQYAAAITDINDMQVRIIIRETFQHPSQLGKVSFPANGSNLPRADIRDTLVREFEDVYNEDDDYDDDFGSSTTDDFEEEAESDEDDDSDEDESDEEETESIESLAEADDNSNSGEDE